MPKDSKRCQEITDSVKKAILLRREASELSWQAVQKVAPKVEGDLELLDDEAGYGFGILNQ